MKNISDNALKSLIENQLLDSFGKLLKENNYSATEIYKNYFEKYVINKRPIIAKNFEKPGTVKIKEIIDRSELPNVVNKNKVIKKTGNLNYLKDFDELFYKYSVPFEKKEKLETLLKRKEEQMKTIENKINIYQTFLNILNDKIKLNKYLESFYIMNTYKNIDTFLRYNSSKLIEKLENFIENNNSKINLNNIDTSNMSEKLIFPDNEIINSEISVFIKTLNEIKKNNIEKYLKLTNDKNSKENLEKLEEIIDEIIINMRKFKNNKNLTLKNFIEIKELLNKLENISNKGIKELNIVKHLENLNINIEGFKKTDLKEHQGDLEWQKNFLLHAMNIIEDIEIGPIDDYENNANIEVISNIVEKYKKELETAKLEKIKIKNELKTTIKKIDKNIQLFLKENKNNNYINNEYQKKYGKIPNEQEKRIFFKNLLEEYFLTNNIENNISKFILFVPEKELSNYLFEKLVVKLLKYISDNYKPYEKETTNNKIKLEELDIQIILDNYKEYCNNKIDNKILEKYPDPNTIEKFKQLKNQENIKFSKEDLTNKNKLNNLINKIKKSNSLTNIEKNKILNHIQLIKENELLKKYLIENNYNEIEKLLKNQNQEKNVKKQKISI